MLTKILTDKVDREIITQIYGPPGSGKTNICIINSINYIKDNGKVVYIDTEGGLSIKRILQIENNHKLLENLLVYNIFDFFEQDRIILKELPKLANEIDLVVVDNITSLYRLELTDKADKNITLNRMLGNQIRTLLKLAKSYNIAVLITNQGRETTNGFEAAGGNLLEYWSKCIIRLEKSKDYRVAYLEKHLYAPEEEIKFEIYEKGIRILG
ncbi:DNA repair and recombination protein RadB [Methanocaldococcus indicus]|uniref:DNA repair and recombination protein RadB n=1 Tax=Methanocaldococcus indicus TaxID=213231 RepID=UPI003C6CE3DA